MLRPFGGSQQAKTSLCSLKNSSKYIFHKLTCVRSDIEISQTQSENREKNKQRQKAVNNEYT
jgi:hypothetical protein